mmetsp:Transcript_89422/g.251833  ORF Transcript_89422/g.251833 Transcript_89422/m.251833 type:complete len:203 (-) Transcript_89422:718-1326(-)
MFWPRQPLPEAVAEPEAPPPLAWRGKRAGGKDCQEADRVLGLISAHHTGNLAVSQRIQQDNCCVLGRRGEGQGGDLMSHVVMRVTETGVTILPSVSPHDTRQCDDPSTVGKLLENGGPALGGKWRDSLEAVPVCVVMPMRGRFFANSTKEKYLKWLERTAARVGPQGILDASALTFPCGDPRGIMKKHSKRLQAPQRGIARH